MFRTVWAYAVAVGATLYFGHIVLLASLLRLRGDLYAECTRRWARAIVRASGVPLQVEGLEHISAVEPQVVVCNHRSAFDIVALASVVPGRFAFVGKKELDRIPFFGRAWIAAGHISIDRSNRHQAMATLQEAGRRIRTEASTVIIFPEGTRSHTTDLLPFKKGAFALAVEAGVPIVPTVVLGSEEVLRDGRVRAVPVRIRFGAPLRLSGEGEQRLETTIESARFRMSEMMGSSALARSDRGR